ncbi:MAG: flagellar biosynthesis repressor FlbT [Rhodospirillales bacterium]|nr:flagellar biosynthesis repressor FlbT [Rhodospirillales bacterium]
MPLKLNVSRGEKFIVNGAVIKNDGDVTSLVFENQAQILRQKDILTQESATTPAARVYLALQCAYLFPDKAAGHLENFHTLLDEYLEAAPSAGPLAEEIRALVDQGQLYAGLKACCRLLGHEHEVLAHVQ